MFHKNGMRPLIIANRTKCWSILCFKSQWPYIRLKYMYSLIYVDYLAIVKSGKWSILGRNLEVHPKTLIEIAVVLSTNSGSFPSNSHVSATFSILLRFGEHWNPTNCEKFNADGSLMGRRILINLCGKNNVRNCDLLQSDFFARCSL